MSAEGCIGRHFFCIYFIAPTWASCPNGALFFCREKQRNTSLALPAYSLHTPCKYEELCEKIQYVRTTPYFVPHPLKISATQPAAFHGPNWEYPDALRSIHETGLSGNQAEARCHYRCYPLNSVLLN